MRKPAPHRRHVVLVGPMGSGKSEVGALLAGRLALPFIDVDARVEAIAGRRITAIFEAEGEDGFRARETQALVEALEGPAAVIATGGGAVLDPGNRAAMRGAVEVVYLAVDPVVQLARLANDTHRPLLQATDPATRLAELQAQREPLYRMVAGLVFDASELSATDAAGALARLLADDAERRA